LSSRWRWVSVRGLIALFFVIRDHIEREANYASSARRARAHVVEAPDSLYDGRHVRTQCDVQGFYGLTHRVSRYVTGSIWRRVTRILDLHYAEVCPHASQSAIRGAREEGRSLNPGGYPKSPSFPRRSDGVLRIDLSRTDGRNESVFGLDISNNP